MPSKIYGATGKFSLKRPWAALLIVAAVTVPLWRHTTGIIIQQS